MTELHIYLKKDNLTEDEEVNLETIKLTLTTYILIQQKIKSQEENTSFFISLEKRDYKRQKNSSL